MPPQSEDAAINKVDKHVSPKKCFVWFMDNKRGYEPIEGTGCAHYVAHEKGWNNGKESSNGCALNFLLRVKDIISKSGSQVKLADVKPGNVFVSEDQQHCGIVRKVTPSKDPKAPDPVILIESSSIKQGKVATNDWAAYYKSGGKFYKG